MTHFSPGAEDAKSSLHTRHIQFFFELFELLLALVGGASGPGVAIFLLTCFLCVLLSASSCRACLTDVSVTTALTDSFFGLLLVFLSPAFGKGRTSWGLNADLDAERERALQERSKQQHFHLVLFHFLVRKEK